MAFATDRKEEKAGNKNNKKKEITCFKCGKKAHYSNECDEEQTGDEKTGKVSNKSGSNFLMMNDNQHGYSSDEDNAERSYANYDFMAIQEANEEHEENEEDDTGTEERSNQDVDNKLSNDLYAEDDDDDEYNGFAYIMTWYALHKTRQVSQKTESYWTTSPQ